MIKLSIIIVSWNVQDKLKENLEAIYKSVVDFDFEVFVVDNNSSDESLKMLNNDFAQVNLIKNKINLGFAKANNQAIRESKGQYILLLNPDMRPQEDTFQNMINWYAHHEDVSLAGCQLITNTGDNIPHIRQFPTTWDQLMIILKIPHLVPSVLDGYLRKDFDYNMEAQVDSIRGGFFMINCKKFSEFPFLDEKYFLWFEEVDFCRMLKQKGEKVYYTPVAKCVDLVGQSFGQVNRFITQKYFRDSMLEYFKKWHGIGNYLVLYLAWLPIIIIAWFVSKLNIKGSSKT